MKRFYWILLVSVPGLLFLSVWQVFQYQMLEQEVAVLEDLQKDLFEKNKRLAAEVARLRSPGRIESLVEGKIEKNEEQTRVRILVSGEEGTDE